MKNLHIFTWVGNWWCRRFHKLPMWPMHSKYVCPECLREFTTNF